MQLRNLQLDEFRSFRKLNLDVDPAGFRLVGSNGSGKSTLLEAIAILATTRSPRTSAEKELAHWRSGEDLAVPPYTRLRGVFERLDGQHAIEIGMSIDERGPGTGSLRKRVTFDDRHVRSVDAVGQLKSVLFSPDDVNLISGPPAARRRYLDMAISQGSRAYLRALSRFNKVLEQRNSLLRSFARDRTYAKSSRYAEELAFWDVEITATSVEIVAVRLGAVHALSSRARQHFASLSGNDSLKISYELNRVVIPDGEMNSMDWMQPAQHLRQTLSASMAEALRTSRDEELRRGLTVLGPHRDDFGVRVNGIDLGRFGSRGQQRLALIALKVAELDLLCDASGEPPLLLLDDVLSELDEGRRASVLDMMAVRNAQICVTATDESDLRSAALRRLPILRVGSGTIVPNGAS